LLDLNLLNIELHKNEIKPSLEDEDENELPLVVS
jgi:hypothetical protein